MVRLQRSARARDAIRQLKKENGLAQGGVAVVVRGGTYSHRAAAGIHRRGFRDKDAPISYQRRAGRTGATARRQGGRRLAAGHGRGRAGQAGRVGSRAGGTGRSAGAGHHRFRLAVGRGHRTVLQRRADDGLALAERGLRADRQRARQDGTQCPRHEGMRRRDLRVRRRPARALGRRAGRLGPRLLVLGLVRAAPQDQVDRHRSGTVIEVQPPYHGYGYRKGQWFYAFNLLSEIDRPGEWYVDRRAAASSTSGRRRRSSRARRSCRCCRPW